MSRIMLLKSIITTISGLLGSKEFMERHRFPKRFVRTGMLSMYHVVMYLLYSTRQAMHQNISRIIDLEPVRFPDVSKQAVSKARQGIAVDGSKIQLPNSASNFEVFGNMFRRDNPGRRWSMALASVIYDVTNDFICHGVLRRFLASERTAAIDHCKALEALGILKGAVLVFDRGYYSEAMFRYFSDNGYLCVMRLKEGIRLSGSCTGDTVSNLTFEDDETGETATVRIRVIAVDLGNGTTEYLATNIFDKRYTPRDFKELYFMRWSLELKYNELKNQLLLEEFNGATSTSVEQEFYINLLYSNLASLAKADADVEIEETAKPENRYRYQANRAYIIGRLKNIFVPILCGDRQVSAIDSLFRSACRNRSQIQPGRSTPRVRFKRDRTHFGNRKTAV